MENSSEFTLMTKEDFLTVKNKYENGAEIEGKLGDVDDFDVLVLTVKEGSGLTIVDFKVINEDEEEVFKTILKEGIPSS